MSDGQNLAAIVGRLMLALIFVIEGWAKMRNFDGTMAYMEANGVPGGLLPFVIMTEFGGGILVAIGLYARAAALWLFAFCLLTTVVFHGDFSDPAQYINALKNLAMAGGFMLLLGYGAGGWSFDAWRAQR